MLGGLAQSIQNSTNDEYMAEEMNKLAEKLVKHVANQDKES